MILGLTAYGSDGNIAGTFVEDEFSFTFNPYEDFNGQVSIDYIVTDNKGAGTPASLSLNIKPDDDAPELGDLPESGLVVATIQEDEVLPLTPAQLISGYIDPDNIFNGIDSTTGLFVEGTPTSPNGTIDLVDQGFAFTPDPDFNGSTQISFIISDGINNVEAFKFVNIETVNDSPTIKLSESVEVTPDFGGQQFDGRTALSKSIISTPAGSARFFQIRRLWLSRHRRTASKRYYNYSSKSKYRRKSLAR